MHYVRGTHALNILRVLCAVTPRPAIPRDTKNALIVCLIQVAYADANQFRSIEGCAPSTRVRSNIARRCGNDSRGRSNLAPRDISDGCGNAIDLQQILERSRRWNRAAARPRPSFPSAEGTCERGIKRRLIVREERLSALTKGVDSTSIRRRERATTKFGRCLVRGGAGGEIGCEEFPSRSCGATRTTFGHFLSLHVDSRGSSPWVSNKLAEWAVAHCLEQIDRLITHPRKNNSGRWM